ncbi:MAG: methylmalonyl Co-A mutase-associated GTPase MeaB [Pseudomonadota bacterium]
MAEVETLATGVLAGERRALSRAITLIESARPEHRERARALLDQLAGAERSALRIGISGAPGVGKSTFLEAFGLARVAEGQRLAVLAVDPSSPVSGGSILGDKTRMPGLGRSEAAFIRPSPSSATLGGVARRTREAIAVCEAAGFDLVMVETVGVGQSEIMVADMTDIFVVLLSPGGGDELQGVKRGIMEMADLLLINKADGALAEIAERTRAEYAGALHLFRRRAGDPEGYPMARTVSAQTGAGLGEAWEAIRALDAARRESGARAARRRAQSLAWFDAEADGAMIARLKAAPGLEAAWRDIRTAVAAGEMTAGAGVDALLASAAQHFGRKPPDAP